MGRVLAFVGDAPWIFALSVMAGASRLAWSKIPPGTPMPTGWTLQGRPAGRWPRATVLFFGPAFGFLIGLPLFVMARTEAGGPTAALVILGVRVLLAALIPFAYLSYLRWAMAVLEREGALRS